MLETDVFINEAVAVGMKAIEQGVAGRKVDRETLLKEAEMIIKRAREQTQLLMKEGFIAEAPAE